MKRTISLTDEVDTTSLYPTVEAVIRICQLSLVTLLSHPMMPGDWLALSLHAQTSAFWHKSCIYTYKNCLSIGEILGNRLQAQTVACNYYVR